VASIELPEDFIRRTIELRGEPGREWLARLPPLQDEVAQRWSLTLGPALPGLSYAFVRGAVDARGARLILKVCFPDREFLTEVEALRAFDGRGAVRLLDFDLDHAALLLERLEPGASLSGVADDVIAVSAAVSVMRELWRPPAAHVDFPSIGDWSAGFGRLRSRFAGSTGPLPPALVGQAERLFAELLASQGEEVLLHGDLHQDNILAAERAPWLAIDPKGVIGERAYEVGALLRNYVLETPDPRRTMERRVAQLADELGVDRTRVRAWGLGQAVLSAWWSIEDHGHGWEPAIACAELLKAVE
jgi:streptomycin 6-kinase